MTTGTDFTRIFDEKIYIRYGIYLDNVEKDDLFKEALIQSLEDNYSILTIQGRFDDMASVIKVNKRFELNNNRIYTSIIEIANITGVLIKTITTELPHNLANGDSVILSDVQGLTTTPAINGSTFPVSIIDTNTFTITVTVTAGVYVANSGTISRVLSSTNADKLIFNYNHLLAIKSSFVQPLPYQILDATNTQPIRIKVDKRNNIKTDEKIYITNVVGNTNANGNKYVKKINTYEFDLYNDKDFLQPVSGNGVYGGTGQTNRIVDRIAVALFSEEKISDYDIPTIQEPRVERGDQMLQIAPYDSVCSEISIDYISNEIQEIISTNTAINLEATYPRNFIYFILDKAVNLYAQRVKDQELFQTSALNLQKEQ